MTSVTRVGTTRGYLLLALWCALRLIGASPDRPRAGKYARHRRASYVEVALHVLVAPFRGQESWFETRAARVSALLTYALVPTLVTLLVIA